VSGLLVPAHDPGAIADALANLITDLQLAARLGSAARTRVTQRFSLEAMVAAMSRLYDELAVGGGNQRLERDPPAARGRV
jgi:glycosyltransferase involved in cell wall biosynthesis